MFYYGKGGGWRRQFIGVPGQNFFMVQHFHDMELIDFRLVGKDFQKRLLTRQYMVMKARQGLARQEGQRKGRERAGQQGQAKAR